MFFYILTKFDANCAERFLLKTDAAPTLQQFASTKQTI